jgi:hypothetical protein
MPRQFTKPIDLYKAQVARFAKMTGDIRKGHREIVREAWQDAQELTSGAITSKQLAAMGHPFGKGASAALSTPSGRRRGASVASRRKHMGGGSLTGLPINRQTGALQRSRYMRKVSGGAQRFDVGFSAAHGKYVLAVRGTQRMVARGYWREAKRRWKPRNLALLKWAARRQRT